MLKWRGNEVMKAIRKDARNKVLQAALLTEAAIKSSMRLGGRTSSGMLAKQERTYKGGSRKGQSILTKTGKQSYSRIDPVTGEKAGKINSFRSKPGEIPRVQTGDLRRSYTHELHKVLPIARVGTNLKYAKWLEFGTRKMAPRPHVWPAVIKLRPTYKKVFGVKVSGLQRGGL